MAKKCSHYANQEVAPTFKGIFNNASQIDQQNYNNLLTISRNSLAREG